MRWERDSSGGMVVADWTPDKLLARNEELAYLMAHERGKWGLINGRIAKKGDLTMMAEGTYGALAAYPPPAALTSLTMSASEQLLIPSAMLPVYTPFPINGILSPQAYRIAISGRYTTSTAPGTVATTVRIGNTTGAPSLGVSAAVTVTASLTNAFWWLVGDITLRSIGIPGSNSTANGIFKFDMNTAVGGAVNSALWGTGSGNASFDSTVSPGATGGCLALNVTGTTTTWSMQIDHIHFMDWN